MAEQQALRTKAGRRLLDAMRFHFPDERAEEWRKEIAAIEQEAARPSVCRHGIDREQLDCRQCEQEPHRHVEVDIAEPVFKDGWAAPDRPEPSLTREQAHDLADRRMRTLINYAVEAWGPESDVDVEADNSSMRADLETFLDVSQPPDPATAHEAKR